MGARTVGPAGAARESRFDPSADDNDTNPVGREAENLEHLQGRRGVMTRTDLYAAALDAYLDAGWSGILPLPRGAKHAPPVGTTGADGRWPSAGDLTHWRNTHGDGNIALRMPLDVIGIDLDLYRNPDARHTLEQTTGPLPPTWCTTSRVDGSGIRLYRVPRPANGAVWASAPVPGVEIVQHRHRYAVVWPSIHPEGRTYLWIDEASGEVADRPPEVDDLTELPWPAIAALQHEQAPAEARPAVDLQFPTGDMSATVERRLTAAIAATRGEVGSRHDAALRDVCALVRLAERGEPGVDTALARLRDAFTAAVAPDRAPGVAAREFDAIVDGARQLVAATVGRIPTRLERDAEWQRLRSITPGSGEAPPTGEEPAPDDTAADTTTGWEPADLTEILTAGYEPPQPAVGERSDGAHLFYPGRVNALNGESGSGKSWVALAACAQQLTAGHHALYIDLEDHAASIVARLRTLAVDDTAIAAGFRYVAPALPYSSDARRLIASLVADNDVSLVVIDSVGEAMALQAEKQNDDDSVVRWFRLLPRHIAALGPAVVLIDHVPKQNDDMKLFAIGSQRKRAAIDGAAYAVDAVVAFSADKTGKVTLTCAKDRNGTYSKGQVVAEINIDPNSVGMLTIDPPKGRDNTGRVTRPTVLMERISRYLEEQSGAVSKREIERMVAGKAEGKRQAVEALVAEGYVAAEPIVVGARRSVGTGYRHVKPFRDEPTLGSYPQGASPASQARPRASRDARWGAEEGASTRVPTPYVVGVGGDAPSAPTDPQMNEPASRDPLDDFEGLI